LADVPFDVLFITKRTAESSDFFEMYADDAATTPVVEDDEVAVLKDVLGSGGNAAQTTGANRPIARLLNDIPLMGFSGGQSLISSAFSTANKDIIFVMQRSVGGTQRFYGGDFNGFFFLEGGNLRLFTPDGVSDFDNIVTIDELFCLRVSRTSSGHVCYRNGNLITPNVADNAGTNEALIKDIGGFGGSFLDGYIGAVAICSNANGPAADS